MQTRPRDTRRQLKKGSFLHPTTPRLLFHHRTCPTPTPWETWAKSCTSLCCQTWEEGGISLEEERVSPACDISSTSSTNPASAPPPLYVGLPDLGKETAHPGKNELQISNFLAKYASNIVWDVFILKGMHCLSEIQMQLDSSYFTSQTYLEGGGQKPLGKKQEHWYPGTPAKALLYLCTSALGS